MVIAGTVLMNTPINSATNLGVWGINAASDISRKLEKIRMYKVHRVGAHGVGDGAGDAGDRGPKACPREAEVEHPIGITKRVFGFVKVRSRGLAKNAHRLVVTCALANLFMARRDFIALTAGVNGRRLARPVL